MIPMIAVCGPNEASEEELAIASEIGRLLAEAGCGLVCGGRGGVMEAAAFGARSGGGTTIGILPGYDKRVANQHIDFAIPTGLGHARNALVAASGEAVIAVGGGFGTLSEIGLALKMGKRVIHVGSWTLDERRFDRFAEQSAQYLEATTAAQAVQLALQQDRSSEHG